MDKLKRPLSRAKANTYLCQGDFHGVRPPHLAPQTGSSRPPAKPFSRTLVHAAVVFLRGMPLDLHSGGFARKRLVPLSAGPYLLLPFCISILETPL